MAGSGQVRTDVRRVGPLQARALMDSGALLVAAYRKGPGFNANYLEGAVPFDEFEALLPGLDRDQGLIFY